MKSGSAPLDRARRSLGPVLAIVILAGGAALRFDHLAGPYEQPDEPVATYVVTQVLAHPGFDTNWAHTQLRGEAGVAQYNFSSYYMTLALFERLREGLGLRPPGESFDAGTVFFRKCSAVFGVLALALAMHLGRRIGGWKLALGAGAWIAVNPLLVQDSHYARPEAFATLLVLGLVGLATARGPAGPWRPIAGGLLFGFLVACKVTMALWFWLPLMAGFPNLAEWRGAGWVGRFKRLGLVAAGALGGFAAGAPRVLLDFGGYLAGIRFLKNGYGGTVHFYSHASGGMVGDIVTRYLWATAGWAVACLFLFGLAESVARRRWTRLLAIYAPTLALLAFMSIQRSFFERNLSHAVPLYLMGAALGLSALADVEPIRKWSPAAFAALACAASIGPAELSERLVLDGFSGRFEKGRLTRLAEVLGQLHVRPAAGEQLVRITSDDDPWFGRPRTDPGPYVALWQDVNPELTRVGLARLHARYTFEEGPTLPGLFDDLPGPNTLRDYLGRTVKLLVFPGRGATPGPEPAAATPRP